MPGESRSDSRPLTGKRWLVIVPVGVVIVAATAIGILALRWPFTEQAIIRALQEGSARTVKIESFHKTYFPPGCVAEQVSFLRHNHPEREPVITVRKLTIQGSY